MIRIKDLTIQKYGYGGLSVSLPVSFHQPRNLNAKDKLATYLSKINDVDCLILASKEIPELSDNNISGNESKMLGNSND